MIKIKFLFSPNASFCLSRAEFIVAFVPEQLGKKFLMHSNVLRDFVDIAVLFCAAQASLLFTMKNVFEKKMPLNSHAEPQIRFIGSFIYVDRCVDSMSMQ